AAAAGTEQHVFFHRLPWEQAATLRHQCNAEIDDLFGGHADEIVSLTVDLRCNGPRVRAYHAHHAFHQRAFAVAIGAEQHHGFAAADCKRDALEHADGAVGGIDVLNRDAIAAIG